MLIKSFLLCYSTLLFKVLIMQLYTLTHTQTHIHTLHTTTLHKIRKYTGVLCFNMLSPINHLLENDLLFISLCSYSGLS